jgi:hypothetical protein
MIHAAWIAPQCRTIPNLWLFDSMSRVAAEGHQMLSAVDLKLRI